MVTKLSSWVLAANIRYFYSLDTCYFRADPLSNMELNFDTKEDAMAFCEKNCKWILHNKAATSLGDPRMTKQKCMNLGLFWTMQKVKEYILIK